MRATAGEEAQDSADDGMGGSVGTNHDAVRAEARWLKQNGDTIPPMEMKSTFAQAKSKQEAVARLCALAQVPPVPLGPGGKEKKSILEAVVEFLFLDVDTGLRKDHLARGILEALGWEWSDRYSSTGQTITLEGLNALLEAAQNECASRVKQKMLSAGARFPEWFRPARNKLEVVRRLSSLTGAEPQDLGPGSKERKSVLVNLARDLGLGVDMSFSKTKLAEAIAYELDMPWTDRCWSRGETLTLEGLNSVLAGAERRVRENWALGAGDSDVSLVQEARLLVAALSSACSVKWDGRGCVSEMREAGHNQWKQIEWVGWYFEFIGLPTLINAYGGGPEKIGSTTFDYVRNYVWDLKTHAEEGARAPGDFKKLAPLNDKSAMDECLSERGSLGFIVLSGSASFGGHVEFDGWHRALRGKGPSTSDNPRKLKVAFEPVCLEAYAFEGEDALQEACKSGELRTFNQGHQASGAPRKPKYQLNLGKARAAGRVKAGRVFAGA